MNMTYENDIALTWIIFIAIFCFLFYSPLIALFHFVFTEIKINMTVIFSKYVITFHNFIHENLFCIIGF